MFKNTKLVTQILGMACLLSVLMACLVGFSAYKMRQIREEIHDLAQTVVPLTAVASRIEEHQSTQLVQLHQAIHHAQQGKVDASTQFAATFRSLGREVQDEIQES